MTRTVLRYLTKTGIVAIEMHEHVTDTGTTSYSYTGKLGAGCSSSRLAVENSIRSDLRGRRGIVLDLGTEVR